MAGKSRVLQTRLEEAEATRLEALAKMAGKTPSSLLRALVRQTTLDEQGQVISAGGPVFQATVETVDEALEILDKAEQTKATLATVRAEMIKQGRYRM